METDVCVSVRTCLFYSNFLWDVLCKLSIPISTYLFESQDALIGSLLRLIQRMTTSSKSTELKEDRGLKKALCPALAIPDDPSVRVSQLLWSSCRQIMHSVIQQCGGPLFQEGKLQMKLSLPVIILLNILVLLVSFKQFTEWTTWVAVSSFK